ncbi:hypothetical protein PS712_03276 [Pseudomonas fluorescens]|jgi:hypothetical protein|uniref:Uncharacterized protein n=1 Tax=Pseudomonas fluorescens TaxID=294 RepID=A0A5E7CVM2_PSEFL|nr:hypothetical protein PS712_03276 [Pseudomonas fluorescens]
MHLSRPYARPPITTTHRPLCSQRYAVSSDENKTILRATEAPALNFNTDRPSSEQVVVNPLTTVLNGVCS